MHFVLLNTYVFVDDLSDFLETTSVHSGEDVLRVGVVDVDGCVVVSTDCCGAGGEHIGEMMSSMLFFVLSEP